MTYALTPSSASCLCKALHSGAIGAILYLEHAAQRLCVELDFEHEADKVAVLIALKQTRHTMRLQAGDPANAQHLREQIEAIANGTADTAETGAIGTPPAPQREPFTLCQQDESTLRHLVRIGGTRHLKCGASITVHNTRQRDRRDALVTTQAGTAHLIGGTPGCLYAVATLHIETALNAA